MNFGQFKKGHTPHNKGDYKKSKYSRFCSKCDNKYQSRTTKFCTICKTQRCSKCKKIKPLNLFWKALNRKNKTDSYCISCRGKMRNHDFNYQRNLNLKKNYNLTLKEYNKMLEKQNGLCAICGQPEIKRNLSVDHSHKTGQIRGLLCTGCNYKLGVLEDTGFVIKAKKYLVIAGTIKPAGRIR